MTSNIKETNTGVKSIPKHIPECESPKSKYSIALQKFPQISKWNISPLKSAIFDNILWNYMKLDECLCRNWKLSFTLFLQVFHFLSRCNKVPFGQILEVTFLRCSDRTGPIFKSTHIYIYIKKDISNQRDNKTKQKCNEIKINLRPVLLVFKFYIATSLVY